MKKTIKAYHPLEMAYHKFMLSQVLLLIITGLPFFSKKFSFLAYGIGYPISGFLGNNEPLSTGLAFLRVIHWASGFFLAVASIMFIIAMISKLKKLSIWPDRWGIDAILDGIKQMKLHYIENKHAKFGKMNMGQKASAWVMVISMLLLMVSGFLIMFQNIEQTLFISSVSSFFRTVHTYSFIVLGLVLVVHVIFALMPSNEKAYKAMFKTGELDVEHVKEHHGYWYEKLNKKELEQ